jgi:PAS domain S-box-containing protein
MTRRLLLPRRGDMARRVAEHDWGATPLGPIEAWPASLVQAVGIVLNCELPMYLAWGPQHVQVYNDAYAPILGPRHPQALGALATDTWPEIWPTIGPMWEQVLAGHSIGFDDYKLTLERFGYPEDCWFNFSYSPVPDDDGRPAGVLVTFVETTQRVLAERRARFQLALSDGLRGLTEPSDITEFTCRMLGERMDLRRAGYATIHDGVVDVNLRGWIDGSMPSVLGSKLPLAAFGAGVVQALERGQTVRIDDVHRDPRVGGSTAVYDGLGAAAMLVVPVVRAARLIAVVAASARTPRHWLDEEVELTEDAAERTRSAVERAVAENALRRQQDSERERMRALFDQAPIFMAALRGPEHVFVLVNPAFERLVGRSDLLGHTVAQVMPEVAPQGYVAVLDEVFASGRPHVAIDAPLVLGEAGTAARHYVDFIYQPIRDPDGAVSGIFIVGSDVTERRAAAEALKEADRRKDEFLAMLAHELRNPLAPIGAAAELLRIGGLDESRVRQTSAVIARQVRHMTGLVDDLLDVSRVTRGLIHLERQRLDCKRLVADAVEQVRPLIEARGHRLTLQSSAAPAFVWGDPKRLVQVLVNLLNNAAKYTPEGGEITLDTRVEGGEVVVTVRDNGIGMTPELLLQAFELFVQAERTSDRAQGGLGIGLALVRSLVGMHGGSVAADSEGTAQGSTFTVRLPLHKLTGAPLNGDAAPAGPPATAAQSRHVLVVDDNADAAQMLALFLDGRGHRVQVQHGSRMGLAQALADPPDVVLLDIGLPDMNGYELAAHLRAEPATRGCLLIAVTGYGQEQDKEAAREAGFDHHVTKPVTMGELLALVENGR